MIKPITHVYNFGPFILDTGEQVLMRDGSEVRLGPKNFKMLVTFVENSGHLLTKNELIKQVWPDSVVEENSIAVAVSNIRKVLAERANRSSYIETVPRRGYRFVASVTEVVDQSGDVSGEPAQTEVYATPRQTEVYARGTQTEVYATSGVQKGTVAVLPFKHIGPLRNEYLGLGMADALITRLSNLRRVTVRPTSSVLKYNGSQDPISAGRELKVEWVVDGSVQRFRNRLRVTVQLVKVDDGVLRWAEKFDEKVTNVFQVEDSISGLVARAVKKKVTRKERRQLAKRYTDNTNAYDAYLRGRYFFAKRTKEDLEKGIECFNQAIALDSNYALAYSGLADCYGELRIYGALPMHECNSKAEEAALRAVELDHELAEAHASLGNLKTRQWEWPAAEIEFKEAIRLNPNYATAHNWYAMYLQLLGRSDDAVIENKRALELDPLSVVFRSTRGKLLYFARHYDLAAEELLTTLELDPDFGNARYCLASVYEAKECYDDARVALTQAMPFFGTNDPEVMAGFGRIHALSGRRSEALEVIDELRRLSEERYVEPYFFAWIQEALREKKEAFDWLERGFAERNEALALLKIDPRMDSLRDDPRFESLLQRVGLTNATNRQTLKAASGGRPR